MLRSLFIKNLGLVQELHWDVPSGFVAITGETGAGKSMILGALQLLIGERADRGLIRYGASSAVIEALFHFQKPQELNIFLEEHGVNALEEGDLLLRRSITAEGSGRQFINGSPATVSLLRDLGKQLLDLHGPHDHQSLFSRSEQTYLLDAFSGAQEVREEYQRAREALETLRREKEELLLERGGVELQQQLAEEVEEIMQAALDPNEEEGLLASHRAAVQGKRLIELAALTTERLNNDEISVTSLLGEAVRSLRELARLDERLEKDLEELTLLAQRIETIVINLEDYAQRVELNKKEEQLVAERLDLLTMLKRKYGSTLEEVISSGERKKEHLELLSRTQEHLSALDLRIQKAEQFLREAMERLSLKRKQGAGKLTAIVTRALSDLGLEHARFDIAMEQTLEPGPQGGEQVDFLFAPNVGEAMQPLRMIASSGEISRVMLALKSAVANQDRIPILIFDEIDANVGGEIASKVASTMKRLADHHQVLCITHLPQVAAAASSQFLVTKEIAQGRTSTKLLELDRGAREEEIARMLGGSSLSALAHAKSLLG